MYKVFFNHTTKAHSITSKTEDENDVEVFKGSLDECKSYLEPLNVMYITIP